MSLHVISSAAVATGDGNFTADRSWNFNQHLSHKIQLTETCCHVQRCQPRLHTHTRTHTKTRTHTRSIRWSWCSESEIICWSWSTLELWILSETLDLRTSRMCVCPFLAAKCTAVIPSWTSQGQRSLTGANNTVLHLMWPLCGCYSSQTLNRFMFLTHRIFFCDRCSSVQKNFHNLRVTTSRSQMQRTQAVSLRVEMKTSWNETCVDVLYWAVMWCDVVSHLVVESDESPLVEHQQFFNDGSAALSRGDVSARLSLHVRQRGQLRSVSEKQLDHLRVIVLGGQMKRGLSVLKRNNAPHSFTHVHVFISNLWFYKLTISVAVTSAFRCKRLPQTSSCPLAAARCRGVCFLFRCDRDKHRHY